MFNISADNDVVTLINVFSVDPEDQRALVHLLNSATDEVMKQMPGIRLREHSSLSRWSARRQLRPVA